MIDAFAKKGNVKKAEEWFAKLQNKLPGSATRQLYCCKLNVNETFQLNTGIPEFFYLIFNFKKVLNYM